MIQHAVSKGKPGKLDIKKYQPGVLFTHWFTLKLAIITKLTIFMLIQSLMSFIKCSAMLT